MGPAQSARNPQPGGRFINVSRLQVADPLFLLSVFTRHCGAGYEKEISFGVLVQLIADALLEHRGSGRKSFARGREQGLLTASLQAVYQKLGRGPLGLRGAWVWGGAGRGSP